MTIRELVVDRLLNLIFSYPTDTWEFAGAILALSFGLWAGLFPGVETNPAFSQFSETADVLPFTLPLHLLIGGVVGTSGLLAFVALFFSRWARFRVWMSAWMVAIWATLAYGFLLSGVASPVAVLLSVFAALTMITFSRLAMTRTEVMAGG